MKVMGVCFQASRSLFHWNSIMICVDEEEEMVMGGHIRVMVEQEKHVVASKKGKMEGVITMVQGVPLHV